MLVNTCFETTADVRPLVHSQVVKTEEYCMNQSTTTTCSPVASIKTSSSFYCGTFISILPHPVVFLNCD